MASLPLSGRAYSQPKINSLMFFRCDYNEKCTSLMLCCPQIKIIPGISISYERIFPGNIETKSQHQKAGSWMLLLVTTTLGY